MSRANNNPNANDNLVHFNTQTAREAGLKSAAARKAKRDALNQAATNNAKTAATALTNALHTFQRDNLGPSAIATAQQLIGRIAHGDIPIRHAGDAADLLRALVDIGRLEAGEATSLSVTLNATDVAERIQRLRAEATGDPGGRTSAHQNRGGNTEENTNTPTARAAIETTAHTETETPGTTPHP